VTFKVLFLNGEVVGCSSSIELLQSMKATVEPFWMNHPQDWSVLRLLNVPVVNVKCSISHQDRESAPYTRSVLIIQGLGDISAAENIRAGFDRISGVDRAVSICLCSTNAWLLQVIYSPALVSPVVPTWLAIALLQYPEKRGGRVSLPIDLQRVVLEFCFGPYRLRVCKEWESTSGMDRLARPPLTALGSSPTVQITDKPRHPQEPVDALLCESHPQSPPNPNPRQIMPAASCCRVS
jgi:hypothetical protein